VTFIIFLFFILTNSLVKLGLCSPIQECVEIFDNQLVENQYVCAHPEDFLEEDGIEKNFEECVDAGEGTICPDCCCRFDCCSCCDTCYYPCEKLCPGSISLWGSFIYWQICQDFMDVGLKANGFIINDECGTSFKHGRRVINTPSSRPGFMLEADYHGCNDWDLFLGYTHYDFNHHKSARAPAGGFLFGRWIQPHLVADNSVSKLMTRWDFELNVADIGIKKWCSCAPQFILWPFFGVEIAWIEQKFKGCFSLLSPPNQLKVCNKSDAWGIGPKIGVDWKWCFAPCFSFVGDIATTIFLMHYDLHLKQHSPTDSTIFLSESNDLKACRPELEMYLGLNYEIRLPRCSHLRINSGRLNLQIGYDIQVWWGQNMMRWFNDSTFIATPQGNFCLRGLRLSGGLDF